MGLSGGAERAIFDDLHIGASPDDLARERVDPSRDGTPKDSACIPFSP